MDEPPAHIILIGCGLANMLLALRLRQLHPGARVTILERSEGITANKTWSFHKADCSEAPWVYELASHHWPEYEVSFSGYTRTLRLPYAAIRPHELLERVLALAVEVRWSSPVRTVGDHFVVLENGNKLNADAVVDGRGWSGRAERTRFAYQKFVGLHLRLERPHGLSRPLLMDTRVAQLDGYRFFYLLPWSEDTLLVEDTRYSDSPQIHLPSYEREIETYVTERGWRIAAILGRESESLPLPLTPLQREPDCAPPRIGMAAALFHPVTGYSLMHAARCAERIARLAELKPECIRAVLNGYAASLSADHKYLLLLNRLMFEAAKPQDRARIFERFYTLSERLIGRFYADRLAWHDKIRLLVGKPPVPLVSAVQTVMRRSFSA